MVGLEDDRRIRSIAANAGEDVQTIIRIQVLVKDNDVPFGSLTEGESVLGRKACFNPTFGKESSQAGGDQFEFVRMFIDEENVQLRFRCRHESSLVFTRRCVQAA